MIILFGGSAANFKEALANQLHLPFICPVTTRPPTASECNGTNQMYVTPDEFNQLIEEGALAEYHTNLEDKHLYGVLKETIEPYIEQKEDAGYIGNSTTLLQLKELLQDDLFSVYMYPEEGQLAMDDDPNQYDYLMDGGSFLSMQTLAELLKDVLEKHAKATQPP